MINKFEIKSHDGPGRIGKLNGEKTPKLFFKTDLKYLPSKVQHTISIRKLQDLT